MVKLIDLKKWGRSRYFLLALVGLILGIFFGQLMLKSVSFSQIWILIGAIFVFGLILLVFWGEILPRVTSFLLIFILAGWAYQLFYINHFYPSIKNFNGQTVKVKGIVWDRPDQSDKTKLTIKPFEIEVSKKNQPVRGNLLAYTDNYPEYKFGDKIVLAGNLQEPPEFPDFNYKGYLAGRGIFATISYPKIEKQNFPLPINIFLQGYIAFKKVLFDLNNHFEETIGKILPEPSSSLLAGLLLGLKKTIPQDLLNAFAATGLTHIVVISGYNITIIVSVFMAITRNWSRILAYLCGILGVISFTIMTGGSAPIVRAAIMSLLIIYARIVGRRSDIGIAVILAATIMIFINPSILRLDLGFQLSFLATMGLIYISPVLKEFLSKIRHFDRLPQIFSETLLATLSAQVLVVPLILYDFGKVSTIAPLANVLVLPFVPLVMLLGFIALVGGLFWVWLGRVLGYLAYPFLQYIISITRKLGSIPGAYIGLNKFSYLWFIAYYLLIVFFVWFYYINRLKLLNLAKNEQDSEK